MFALPNTHPRHVRAGQTAAALLLVLLLAMGLVACGETDKSEVPVAQVEDRIITLEYFERKMNNIDENFLPKNIDTTEGRLELLESMVNKEVMALKAEELGFDSDGAADEAGRAMATLNAVKLMKDDMVEDLRFISNEEVQEYYENFGRNLRISYMLMDHASEAIEARNLVLGGESWGKVADRLGIGDPGPNGNWTTMLKYGTIVDDVERAAFELSVGDISEPIPSIYGYFLIRVDGQAMERVPPLDSVREKILESVFKQKKDLASLAFIHEVYEEFNFVLNDEALDILYEALPEDLDLLPQPPKEEQPSLNIHPSNLDMILMSWEGEEWSLRRYYDFYEATGWLARPRREKFLGGLRRHLQEIAVRELMPKAARSRGYFDRPEVIDEQKERREQAMVGRLHRELIANDVKVTPADVDTFWANNKDMFRRPETRGGLVLITSSEQQALAASVAAKAGGDWTALVEQYGAESAQPEEGAEIGPFAAASEHPLAKLFFQVDTEGGISYPSQIDTDKWAIVRLDGITPAQDAELTEVGMQVNQVLERRLADRLFNERVEAWKADMLIRRYPRNLDKAELNRVEQREGMAPGVKPEEISS